MAPEAEQKKVAGRTKSCMIVGISGPSSSGKSTIARHLRAIYDGSFILHQDDFFLPESELPKKAGHLDWDSAESLDLSAFRRALEHIRNSGSLPGWLESKEDQNSVGPSNIKTEVFDSCQRKVKRDLTRFGGRWGSICFVDGFLLYGPESVWDTMADLLDLRLFLPASFEEVKERRSKRSSYVTLEGFWEDPEGYVEDVVWPNYVDSHKHLFTDSDVEKPVDRGKIKEFDIWAYEGSSFERNISDCLVWSSNFVLRCQLDDKDD
ncbi:MAG: ribosylnicotinamide kinase [Vezdaea aestivalis]|nr:MAG: ribosylnicotinamide kinase [Vezdaea aestivalis]